MKQILILCLLFLSGMLFCLPSCRDNEEVETSAPIANTVVADVKSATMYYNGLTGDFRNIADTIGLYSPEQSRTAYLTRDVSGWQASGIALGEKQIGLYTYYPYREMEHKDLQEGYIDVEHISQTDYMYSGFCGYVSRYSPKTSITMKHALSLLSFRFERKGYDKPGILEKISVRNREGKTVLYSKGQMVLGTGKIIPLAGYNDAASLVQFPNPVIPNVYTNEAEYIYMLVLPVDNVPQEGDLLFEFVIDGQLFSWPVAQGTSWEKGIKHTYRVEMAGNKAKSGPDGNNIHVILSGSKRMD